VNVEVRFKVPKRELRKLPEYILRKLQRWAEQVELLGLREVRKAISWHDEPLVGKRRGQRSIRLSRSYRAIYVEEEDSGLTVIVVVESHKHKY